MQNIDLIKKQAQIVVNLYNAQKFDEVVQKGKILIKKFPEQVIFYNATSLSLSALDRDKEALKIMKEALINHPKNIHVLNNLGLISGKLNNNKLAREYFSQALSLNNNFIYLCFSIINRLFIIYSHLISTNSFYFINTKKI